MNNPLGIRTKRNENGLITTVVCTKTNENMNNTLGRRTK
jgi:hypothetical protein